jgi:hypothetical protein
MLFPMPSLAILAVPDRNVSRYLLCRQKTMKSIKIAEKVREFLFVNYIE